MGDCPFITRFALIVYREIFVIVDYCLPVAMLRDTW
jgi:hypothetical protein